MRRYEDVGYPLEIRRGGDGERALLFDAECLDVTKPRARETTWLFRQKAGVRPACSFRVTVPGRSVRPFQHPTRESLELKLGMLMAIREELSYLADAIRTGAVIVQNHPVSVTEAHLAEGVRKAYARWHYEDRGRSLPPNTRRPRRKVRITQERRAQLKRQGIYIGSIRSLPPQQKARVKRERQKRGYAAAIRLAKRLARAA